MHGVRPAGNTAGAARCGRRGCHDSATFSLRLRLQHQSRCRCVPELQLRDPDVVEVTLVRRGRSGQGFRSLPPITHAMRLRGPPGWSLVARSASGVMCGSGPVQYPAGCDYWRQCADRRRQCGHSRRACWRYCLRQSSALASLRSRSSSASAERVPTARFDSGGSAVPVP